MSKKRNKNSNYVTEKTTQAKLEKERAKKAKRIKRIVKQAVAFALALVICVGGITGLGFAFGWWDYTPTPTYHASIEVEGYGALHVELYGNDAPNTVAQFKKLADSKHFNGKSFDSLFGEAGIQCSSGGATPITGEFKSNGVDNKITFTKGTLAMLLPTEGNPNSANGSFFILTENERSLKGEYAAFGRVTEESMELLEKIAEDMKESGAKPKITSVSVHAAH